MSVLTLDAVADLAFRAGFRGEGLVTSLAVQTAENGTHDTARINTTGNTPPSRDRGLWQINDHFHPEVPDAVAFDGAANAREAYRISGGGTNFGPWSTFKGGQYKAHLTEARTAATAATARQGGPSGATSGQAPADPTAAATAIVIRDPAAVPYGSPDALPVDSRPLLPSDLRILGAGSAGAYGPIVARVTSIDVDLSLEQLSALTVVLSDPGLAAFGAGLLMEGLAVDLGDLHFVVDAVATGDGPAGETVTLTCYDIDGQLLKLDRSAGPGAHLGSASPAGHLVDFIPRGVRVVTEPTSDTPLAKVLDTSDTKGRLESTWDQWARFAQDAGYLFNVGGGVAYFARPSFIASVAPGVVVRYRAGIPLGPTDPDYPFAPYGVPGCRMALDETDAGRSPTRPGQGTSGPVTVSVNLPQRRASRIRPGMRLELYGMAAFDGPYLITSVKGSIDNDLSAWVITARNPVDPAPKQAATGTTTTTAGTPSSTTTPGTGTKQATDFVALAQSQAGKAYVYGAEAGLSDPDPNAFDCSELVQWAASRAGVYMPDGSGAQYAYCAKRGTLITPAEAAGIRGAILFMGRAGSDHVAISLGDGKSTIEARGKAYGVTNAPVTGRPWSAAATIPDMAYPVAKRSGRAI